MAVIPKTRINAKNLGDVLCNLSLANDKGFHSRDLYTKFNYFEGVATQENNDSDRERLFS